MNLKTGLFDCEKRDMKLLQIDTKEILDSILLFSDKNWPNGYKLRVDGFRNTTDGEWYNDHGKVLAWAGLKGLIQGNQSSLVLRRLDPSTKGFITDDDPEARSLGFCQ